MLNSVKDDLRALVDHLPDDADMDEVHYRLYVIEKIRKSRETMEKGGVMSQAEAELRFAEWRKNWK